MLRILAVYMMAINILAFVTFFADKKKAAKDKWRIKERTLHILSFAGGSVGSIAAMVLFHHKTKKFKFCVITAVAALTNVAVLYLLMIYVVY